MPMGYLGWSVSARWQFADPYQALRRAWVYASKIWYRVFRRFGTNPASWIFRRISSSVMRCRVVSVVTTFSSSTVLPKSFTPYWRESCPLFGPIVILEVAALHEMLHPLRQGLSHAVHHGGGARDVQLVGGLHQVEPLCRGILQRGHPVPHLIHQQFRPSAGDRIEASGLQTV